MKVNLLKIDPSWSPDNETEGLDYFLEIVLHEDLTEQQIAYNLVTSNVVSENKGRTHLMIVSRIVVFANITHLSLRQIEDRLTETSINFASLAECTVYILNSRVNYLEGPKVTRILKSSVVTLYSHVEQLDGDLCVSSICSTFDPRAFGKSVTLLWTYPLNWIEIVGVWGLQEAEDADFVEMLDLPEEFVPNIPLENLQLIDRKMLRDVQSNVFRAKLIRVQSGSSN